MAICSSSASAIVRSLLHQLARRCGERVVLSGAKFDLAGNQLTGETIHEVGRGGALQILESVDERKRRRIEELIFLLESDREIGRFHKAFANACKQPGFVCTRGVGHFADCSNADLHQAALQAPPTITSNISHAPNPRREPMQGTTTA